MLPKAELTENKISPFPYLKLWLASTPRPALEIHGAGSELNSRNL